jgi:PLD-like domain
MPMFSVGGPAGGPATTARIHHWIMPGRRPRRRTAMDTAGAWPHHGCGRLARDEVTEGNAMADPQFAWDDLGKFKAGGRFLDGYPSDERTFFAPRDDVHGLLVALLGSAQHSIVVNMFGYDDDVLNQIIQAKLADEHVFVQMSLDRSQASGAHEKEILARWSNDAFGNSIAIGTSSVHNAISHLKIVIVDGVYTVKGSTNWSLSGEQQQDNELSLSRNAVIAAETRAILDLNHDFMLKQMTGSKLDVGKFLAPLTADSMPPMPPHRAAG